jgi:hypothetical protein
LNSDQASEQTQPTSTSAASPQTTKTDTTTNWLPTTLITAEASALSATASASATAAAYTSGLPKAIAPDDVQEAPSDYKLITVGFKESLNYPFVVKNSLSSAQIFEYLPILLKSPFNLNESNVTVVQLVPFSSSTVSYIITVAEVYFPSQSVSELQSMVLDSSSSLYQNDDPTVSDFSKLIDSSIPLTGLLDKLGSSSGSSSSSSGSSSQAQGVSPLSGSMEYSNSQVTSNTNKSQSGKIAGITIGSVVGGTVYISLLLVGVRFFIVRKRIRLESAQNSILPTSTNGSVESFGDVAYGAGVRLPSSPSVDTRQSQSPQMSQTDSFIPRISKPVAAQNSLGWT